MFDHRYLDSVMRWPADRVVRVGIYLLFFFVSVVPHRYVLSYGTFEFFLNHLAWLPSALILVLSSAMIRDRGGTAISSAPLMLPLVAVLTFNLLGGISSEVPFLALSRESYYFLTGAFLLPIVIYGFGEPRQVDDLFSVILVISTLVASYGVYEFVVDTNPLWGGFFRLENPRYAQFAEDSMLFGSRIKSTVGHPVYLGAYLVLCLPICISVAVQRKSSRAVYPWVGVGLVCTAILLTFSRGSWVGSLMSGAVYLRRHAVRNLLLACTVIVLFIASALSFDRVWETLQSRGTVRQLKEYKTNPRGLGYWQATSMIQDMPFWGVGTAQYRYLSHRYKDYDDTPDNMFLRLLGENGIVGFCALLMVYALLSKEILDGERRSISCGSIVQANNLRAILASVFGFWTNLLTCDGLYFPLTRIAFWILVGAGLGITRGLRGRSD